MNNLGLVRGFWLSAIMALVAFMPQVLADSFSDTIKGLTAKPGFFNLYGDQKQAKLLMELTELEQPFIYVTSLPQGIGSNDIGLDRGQLGESRLVQFERIAERVVLRQLNPYYRAKSDNASERSAIQQAFSESILVSFEIIAERKNSLLIDVANWSIQDIHDIEHTLKGAESGHYQINSESSFADWSQSKSFATNTELSAVVTFNGEPKGQHLANVTPDARFVSLRFRHSLVKLPDDKFMPRKFHPYSGYFPFEYLDYAQPIAKPLSQKFIYRHRLTKDSQGKVTKPIVYYLDPGVPEPVRGALLDGARWWSSAFDAAGFKGGFRVELLPQDADPLDVRYNVIQWVHRSTRGWSYGSSVTDPRSGEIIKGHVTLGSLRVKQDYLIGRGLLAGQQKQLATQQAQSMALARIRQLAAHEVGHTLGVAHNFAASVNQRASVMDYPHPLIELKSGKIDLSNAYTAGLGAWDHYVINYGYAEFSDEAKVLNDLIEHSRAQNYKFISDVDARAEGGANPWAHLWDNGAKADEELARLIRVRAVALAEFNSSILATGQAYSELREMLVPLYLLHRYQVEAAAKIIGAVDYNYAIAGESLSNHPVSAVWQRTALASVLKTLSPDFLTLPPQLLQLLPPKAYGFSASRESFSSANGPNFDPVSIAEASARHSLNYLLNSERLNRVMLQHNLDPLQLSLRELVTSIIDQTMKSNAEQAATGLSSLVAKRLDLVVTEQLLSSFHDKATSPEVKSQLHELLTQLQAWLNMQVKQQQQLLSHYRQLAIGLEKSLEDASFKLIISPAKLPPGSPI